MGHVYKLSRAHRRAASTTPSPRRRRGATPTADITYGTNNEFGFDYLRDNMVFSLDQRVQREHDYAIVDEVDSVLIDEARTPLIICGPVGNDGDDKYADVQPPGRRAGAAADRVVNQLIAEAEPLLAEDKKKDDAAVKLFQAQRGMPKNKKLLKLLNETGVKQLVQRAELDYMPTEAAIRQQQMRGSRRSLFFVLDEKGHTVHLTDQGSRRCRPTIPTLFLVPDISEAVHAHRARPRAWRAGEARARASEVEAEYAAKSEKLHIIHKLLQAHALYEKDVEYVVQDGQVLIVDEFTGRVMPGRRWSDGLHQAVEAKEGVQVKGETQTLATITIQNYFRMYDKLAGMTGTAETEETEFYQIYGLEVAVIPDQPADPPHRPARPDLQDPAGEVQRGASTRSSGCTTSGCRC